MKEYCPNCFDSSYQNGICPQCGYRLQNDRNRSARNLPAGSILNHRYYVGRLLGAGGFGLTYKAYDIQRREMCCIKEYAPTDFCSRVADGHSIELLSREYEEPYRAGLRRFIDEARILGSLGGIPSVVNILNTFQENNTAYFTMELLTGADLKQIVPGGRLSFRQVTEVILQVALSMDMIHTKTGIIHRDISPENIFITKDGRVKLIDFGSAKRTENGVKDGLSVVLKPKYAPPEQFSSKMLQGPFTDVYSLASTYYYALTKQNVPMAMDRLAGKEYIPLKQMNLGVPTPVSNAVDHALILNVNHRTPSMQVFVAEVAEGLTPSQAVTMAFPAGGSDKKASPHVVLVSAGPQHGKRLDFQAGQSITVGRSAEADFQIQYPDISRIHCQVGYAEQAEAFVIQDMSMNGTFFQGVRLKKGISYQAKGPVRFVLANRSCVIELGT